jgi:membrane-associated phospholipid phosphatase
MPVHCWMKYLHTLWYMHAQFDLVGPALEFIGDGTVQAATIILLLLAGPRLSPRFRPAGKGLFAAFVASGVSVQLLKHLTGRGRPELGDAGLFIGPTFLGSFDSFPSGHAAVSFCLAFVAGNFFPGWRRFLYLLAIAIGFARVMTGIHFVSDVIAGAVLGLVLGKILSVSLLPRIKIPAKKES